LEFIFLIGLGLIAALCISLAVALLPLLDGVNAPGSGGGAQMVTALFFGPIVLVSAILAFFCILGVVAILMSGRQRRGSKDEPQHPE
jgi:hypothetical protein